VEEVKELGIIRVFQKEMIARYRSHYPTETRTDMELLKALNAAEDASKIRKADIIEEWVFRQVGDNRHV
jgi:hypothetical protein